MFLAQHYQNIYVAVAGNGEIVTSISRQIYKETATPRTTLIHCICCSYTNRLSISATHTYFFISLSLPATILGNEPVSLGQCLGLGVHQILELVLL